MIHGRLNSTSWRLTEIGRRPAKFADDVPLAEMPVGDGPFTYDSVNKLAVSATKNEDEKLDDVDIPLRVLKALVVRLDTNYQSLPANIKNRVQNIINSASAVIVNALQQ